MNLYQHAKNHATSSFCSRDIFYSKILQSDCSRAFWPIFQELVFSQMDMYEKVVPNVDIYACVNTSLHYLNDIIKMLM